MVHYSGLTYQKEWDYFFYLKVHVNGSYFAHLRVLQRLPPCQHWDYVPMWPLPQLMAIEYEKALNDTLEYFVESRFACINISISVNSSFISEE